MTSVLIVEDEAPVARTMRRWLEPCGHVVRHAASAEEALEEMSADSAAVAVCDVGLPGKDGYWLTGELRERYPETAVVLATGAAEVPATISLRKGVVAYLLKPFGRDELRRAVLDGMTWHDALVTSFDWMHRLRTESRDHRVDLRLRFDEIVSESDGAVESMIEGLFPRTDRADHAHRVAALARRIGRRRGLPDGDLVTLNTAALLHELGNLTVPDAILVKPSALTSDERTFVERVPSEGYEVLHGHPRFADAGDLVRATRERFAGGGYPRGLKGDQIPLGSRILAVADTYDTITYPRPFRDALPTAEATLELLRCTGTQFDPEVVQALLEVL
jgi:response regulator RpfG family c-di-GMP phosphodiesterase